MNWHWELSSWNSPSQDSSGWTRQQCIARVCHEPASKSSECSKVGKAFNSAADGASSAGPEQQQSLAQETYEFALCSKTKGH